MYPNGQEELYHLKADPNDWNNLACESKYEAMKNELGADVQSMMGYSGLDQAGLIREMQ